jgi:hypothetical protein
MRRPVVRALIVAVLAMACLPFPPAVGSRPVYAAYPGHVGLIAFDSSQGGTRDIWTMNPNGTNQTRITQVTVADTWNGQPRWSPDGTRMAFASSRTGSPEIWVMNADGSGQTQLTDSPATSEHGASWSPDGSRIAFARTTAGGDYDIWLMDADGSDQVVLADGPSFDTDPSWSPDGQQVAFVSTIPGSNSEIVALNVDGSGTRNLTNTPETNEAHPDWSPDGTRIAFTRGIYPVDDRAGIWIANADGSNPHKIGGNQHSHSLSWSPDGYQLSYVDTYETGIFRIAANGTTPPVRITSILAEYLGTSWQPRSTPPPPTGEFTSLSPERILDTRDGTGRDGAIAPLGSGETIDVQVAGRGGVATSGVSAVVLNATVTGPTAPSFLTIWPTGIARPEISNLNYGPGQTVPNLVTVAVGPSGKVSVFNLAGSAHVIFDVVGFYAGASGPPGSRFHPIDPYRYFDTRNGSGGVGAQPIGSDSALRFHVLGKGGVPTFGVTAVVMNVTVTGPTSASYLTVYPDDVARPVASNLNFQPGQTVPNLVTVRVPPSGVVDFYNLAGSVHVIADVVGYYDGDKVTDAGRFIPLAPSRTVDTRANGGPLGPNEYFWLDMPGWNGVPSSGAGAVVINTTVTQPTAPSFLTVFPDDLCEIPLASNLNYGPGQTVPNLVIVRLSQMRGCANAAGAIDFYNRNGYVHVLADVFGYFTDDSAVLP